MKSRIASILALLCVLIAITALAGYALHGRRDVLLHVHTRGDAHVFLVADGGSLVISEQHVTASPGTTMTASFDQFDQLSVTGIGPGNAPVPGLVTSQLIVQFLRGNSRDGWTWIHTIDASLGKPPITFTFHAAAAPLWAIALALLIWPIVRFVRIVRRRRREGIGFCPDCGYDLRASPSRCPECGLAVSEATAA